MVAVPALAFPVASTVVSRNDHPARKDGLSIEREVLEAKHCQWYGSKHLFRRFLELGVYSSSPRSHLAVHSFLRKVLSGVAKTKILSGEPPKPTCEHNGKSAAIRESIVLPR